MSVFLHSAPAMHWEFANGRVWMREKTGTGELFTIFSLSGGGQARVKFRQFLDSN